MIWRDVGNQSVSWCAADAFTDPVHKPSGEDHSEAGGQGKQRLRYGSQGIATNSQRFSFSEMVAERTGKDLYDQRQGLGQAFDNSHRGGTGAEDSHHKQGEKAVDHFRRNVHQEADESEYPDPGWEALAGVVRWHGLDHMIVF